MANYLSVSEYAKTQRKKNGKLGISTAAVYNRFKRDHLTMVKVNGLWLVDINSYQPGKSGRPKKIKHEKK